MLEGEIHSGDRLLQPDGTPAIVLAVERRTKTVQPRELAKIAIEQVLIKLRTPDGTEWRDEAYVRSRYDRLEVDATKTAVAAFPSVAAR